MKRTKTEIDMPVVQKKWSK